MTSAPIDERLARLSRLLQADDRERTGLMPVQLRVVQYLSRCNRFSDTPAAVADYLGITKGTASQTIKVVERAGLVAKSVDPDDGRVVHLHLTDAGRALARDTAAEALLSGAIAALDDEDRDALETGVAALLEAVRLSTGGRTFGACHSCRFLRSADESDYRCGLLHEPLSSADTQLICREHEVPVPVI